MASDSEPRRLEAGDAAPAAALIAKAFAWHEPWGAWIQPDESTREERMREKILDDIEQRFLPHGECWTIDLETVTLWIPPRDAAGSEWFQARRSEEDYLTYGDREPAIRAVDELIRNLRPDEPHWFLDTIATEPDLFGQGLAGKLLAHDLEVRDRAGEVCALDTHTPRQVAFYERFGFEVVGRGEPAPDFPIVVMVRQPQPA